MRVLLVAYYFPPIGGAGVQRAVKFAKHLAELGHEMVVVTGPGQGQDRWAPHDETLGGELTGVAVERIEGEEHPPSLGWTARSERWFRRQSPWAVWWTDGILRKGRIAGACADVILATMSPFESAEAVARLARELRVPWVADLRDPWALDEMRTYATRLHRTLERRTMRRALGTAAAIVMNTQEAALQLASAFPELAARQAPAIPNGFDPCDFALEAERREDAAFRIVHAGYLHTETPALTPLRRLLGGRDSDVDILTRSHVYLLRALDSVIRTDPSFSERVELHLAGVLSPADRALADRSFVRDRGYLNHRANAALLKSADLLFLPMHNLPEGRRATIVPGKTYEYLASGRPILAAVPDGDARDLLERAGAFVCRPDDVDQMAVVIRSLADGSIAPPKPRQEVLAPYRREHLAREMAAVLESAVQFSARADRRCTTRSGSSIRSRMNP